jgi:hypothetical protein
VTPYWIGKSFRLVLAGGALKERAEPPGELDVQIGRHGAVGDAVIVQTASKV